MAFLKSDSLESFLQFKLWFLCLLVTAIISVCLLKLQVQWQWVVVADVSFLLFSLWFIASIKQKVMRTFTRALLHIDALSQEDYNQFGKSVFSQGKVKEFHQQLKVLSEQLQHKKAQYDQHAYLVYQLIAQLDTPILVFNQKHQLSYGNDAFEQLYKQPWQMFRHSSAELLGLQCIEGQWQFIEPSRQQKWQIRHSEFIDDGQAHQLLVFINIEPALRDSQLQAWRQIIRVLSHEIRNSLTPVSSMAETLADRATNEKDKMVLEVITDRCTHLQSFVDRYGSISQQLQLNCQWQSLQLLVDSKKDLFKELKISLNSQVKELWVDREFFEQVLINLLKNAHEAQASEVVLNVIQQDQYHIIELVDNGHGFKNLDNLFVPLYTTKSQGQGIGLSFSRNIIEQHNGVMELHNNREQGVTVMIILPIP